MFIVYVIENEAGKRYIGQTSNVEKRLERHNKRLPYKKTNYTAKQGKNWKIVYAEEFITRNEALKREKELKSFQGREYIKKILMGR